MSAAAIEERENRQVSARLLHAQAGGTLVLRTNAIVCRALENTGTITAFALSHGLGM